MGEKSSSAKDDKPSRGNQKTPRSGIGRFFPRSVNGILIFLLLVVIVPFMLVEAGHYYALYDQRRAQEFQANLEIARSVSAIFDLYVREILHQESVIGTAIVSPEPLPPQQANRLLATGAHEYPSIR